MSTSKWFKFLAIAFLILGIIFRFANLGIKPYWNDESFTSVQLYGFDYNAPSIKQQIEQRIIDAEQVQHYLYPNPRSTMGDTVSLIAQKEPQLAPLYFILEKAWIALFGNSVAVIRSFSAVAGILLLPAIYFLAMELFSSQSIACLAVILIAISPFFLMYSQEARPYSLWSLTIVLSQIALLRAMRKNKANNWLFYVLATILNLYTYVFSLLILLGQGLYVLLFEKFRLTRRGIAWLICALMGLIGFIPWLMIFLPNTNKANQGSFLPIPKAPVQYMMRWIRSLGLVFADFNVSETSSKMQQIFYAMVLLAILALVSYAIYFLVRTDKTLARLLLLSTLFVSFFPLFFKDLLTGGGVSTSPRYLIPCWLSIVLIVAYLLVKQSEQTQLPKLLWSTILSLIILIEFSSSLFMIKSELWWNKAQANLDRQFANEVLNKAKHPLVISDNYFPGPLSLSISLNPQVRFLLFSEQSVGRVPANESEVFLYRPSQVMLKGLKKDHQLEPVLLKDAYGPGGDLLEPHFFRVLN